MAIEPKVFERGALKILKQHLIGPTSNRGHGYRRVADALHCGAAYIANNVRPSGGSPAPFLKHHFCSICGIHAHHQGRSNPSQYGYNVGCLEGGET
jgi:hypothetical protein